MKKTKRQSPVYAILMVLIAVLIIAITPTEAEGAVYEDTVRLHILANSDSEVDQNLKLQIRDFILEEYSSELSLCNSKAEAEEKITYLKDEICERVNFKIQELGFDYEASVKIDMEWYETRNYEDFSLPCGYYTSVQVLLGDAEGKNWWCVMYPPMCFDIATSDKVINGYTEAEATLIKGEKYSVKFKLLELFSELSGKVRK